jgi:copper homeostasis protein
MTRRQVPRLEICIDSLRSALAAEAGGADRLEVCQSLELGGLSPSAGLLAGVRERSRLPLFVMLRPRAGDFVHDELEREQILRDLDRARELGADGYVSGALTRDGDIDAGFLERLVDEVGEQPLTFHRAFDHCRDPRAGLETLIACGVKRVLTSGQAPSVEEGVELLGALQEQARGRITLLLGGGLRAETLRAVLEQTGAQEVHASASIELERESGPEGIRLGSAGLEAGARRVTDEQRVRALRAILDERAG